jgi:hypothetical protein
MATGFAAGCIARARTAALLIACTVAIAAGGARAEMNAQLPTTTACKSASAPKLPAKWRAVALMMPFLEGQIDVAELVQDTTVPAMRATVYGMESGAVDLLITEQDTYRLSGPHDAPTQCKSLGRMFRPAPVQWLPEKSVCVGEGTFAKQEVEWWKSPGPEGKANWHRFNMHSRLPWRSVFTSPAGNKPIIGQYAMSYFPTFAAVEDTNLSQLSAFCAAQVKAKGPAAAVAPRAPRALMDAADREANAERRARISALIPGTDHEGCRGAKPAQWPEHFVMTATLVPISFADEPTASLIFYDWGTGGGQFAVMFQGRPPRLQGLVGMKKGVGYRLENLPSGPRCEAVFPGMVRPDWMNAAGCRCRATLAATPSLGLSTPSRIFSCPIKRQAGRVMWSWYTDSGEPIVFFEAGASGGGVMLADRHQWKPGTKLPAYSFQLPGACYADDAQRQSGHGGRFDAPDCSDCHTTR